MGEKKLRIAIDCRMMRFQPVVIKSLEASEGTGVQAELKAVLPF
jgi:hypothetical protein